MRVASLSGDRHATAEKHERDLAHAQHAVSHDEAATARLAIDEARRPK